MGNSAALAGRSDHTMTHIRAGFAQIAPAWLDRKGTLGKVLDSVSQAADQSIQLLAFGEALVPGYPFWPELTGGAVFESDLQKELFAHYAKQAVNVSGGDLDPVSRLCKQRGIAVYLRTMESWRNHYNHVRPHSGIGRIPPKVFARQAA